ncbi:RDD family protein [Vampirovibrio sp.]|uniref:RDD family protein n=1 Tax=Vampirovibrio sp. TaxID=2717857 RepID=UPI00359325C2
MEIRSIHTIETAENIHIKVALAGIAPRVCAFLADAALMGVLTGLVIGLFALWAYVAGNQQISKTGTPLGVFVVFFGYHLFQEWLWNGRTVGKLLFSIRVVRNNGQALGFWESLGRNLLRLLDVYVFGIGLLCMMFHPGEKRFGDLVGGTIVINDAKILKPAYPVAMGEPSPQSSEFSSIAGFRLTAEEAELLKAYQARRDTLLKPARAQLVDQLAQYFSEKLHHPITSEADLDAVLVEYQQGLNQSLA